MRASTVPSRLRTAIRAHAWLVLLIVLLPAVALGSTAAAIDVEDLTVGGRLDRATHRLNATLGQQQVRIG